MEYSGTLLQLLSRALVSYLVPHFNGYHLPPLQPILLSALLGSALFCLRHLDPCFPSCYVFYAFDIITSVAHHSIYLISPMFSAHIRNLLPIHAIMDIT